MIVNRKVTSVQTGRGKCQAIMTVEEHTFNGETYRLERVAVVDQTGEVYAWFGSVEGFTNWLRDKVNF